MGKSGWKIGWRRNLLSLRLFFKVNVKELYIYIDRVNLPVKGIYPVNTIISSALGNNGLSTSI